MQSPLVAWIKLTKDDKTLLHEKIVSAFANHELKTVVDLIDAGLATSINFHEAPATVVSDLILKANMKGRLDQVVNALHQRVSDHRPDFAEMVAALSVRPGWGGRPSVRAEPAREKTRAGRPAETTQDDQPPHAERDNLIGLLEREEAQRADPGPRAPTPHRSGMGIRLPGGHDIGHVRG